MSDLLPAAPAGRPRAGRRRRAARARSSSMPGPRRRPPCCSSASAPSAPPRSSSTSRRRRSRRSRSRWPRLRQVARRTRARPSGTSSSRPSMAEAYVAEGGVEFAREVLERSLGAERAARDHRPPVGDDRAPAVRVPAPHAAGADLRLPAQRGAADDRARHREPPHDARRAGALRSCSPSCRPTSPLRVAHDDRDQPGRHCSDVERVMQAEALERHHAGVRRGGRRQVAGRDPQPRRPPDRAQRPRLARRVATPTSPSEIRMLLFTFEDIVKLDDRRIQLVLKEVDQKDLALALRGVPRRGQGQGPHEHVRSAAPRCSARRWSSSRRSAAASSRRPRAASSRSSAASRRPARSSSAAAAATRTQML